MSARTRRGVTRPGSHITYKSCCTPCTCAARVPDAHPLPRARPSNPTPPTCAPLHPAAKSSPRVSRAMGTATPPSPTWPYTSHCCTVYQMLPTAGARAQSAVTVLAASRACIIIWLERASLVAWMMRANPHPTVSTPLSERRTGGNDHAPVVSRDRPRPLVARRRRCLPVQSSPAV